MKTLKSHLLAATTLVAFFAPTSAQATAVAYTPVTVDGNGASSIIVVLNKAERCLGTKNPIGFTNGTSTAYPDHVYSPISPTAGNPNWNCGTQNIQPDLNYRYISTGSGAGRTNWSKFNLSGFAATFVSPFVPAYSGHVQYALSDSAITAANLTDYTNLAVPNGTGAAIQIPFYVLPIALPYSPVYGKRDTATGTVPLSYNVKASFVQKATDGVTVTGGLHLKRTTYCAILNGTITNWNDAALTADNGGQSLRDANDDLTRWNTAGVPIKLVGRSDNSGTTNIFTRHLAIACPGTDYSGLGGTDQLPSARKGTAVYDQNTGALISGTETAGKFGLSAGNAGVAAAIGQTIAAPAAGSGSTNLGGYFGYAGADFVIPATLGTTVPVLYSANLQQGATTTFKMPTPTNATAAFGTTFLPPQSTTAGKYTLTPAAGSQGNRNDPLAWALAQGATTGLANPAIGYPIVGTTNLLIYTCYSTPEKRSAIVALAAQQFGFFKTSKLGTLFPAALVNSTAKGANGLQIGVLSQNGISNMPASWKTAIWETFFTKTVTGANPSTLNLWIQDKLPTTQASVATLQSNSTCSANTGA